MLGPRDPNKPLRETRAQAQQLLAAKGLGNFSIIETTIGPRGALLLEFLRLQYGGTWSCREYFVAEGTLYYTPGFGTSNKDAMFELYDRMARSLEFSAE